MNGNSAVIEADEGAQYNVNDLKKFNELDRNCLSDVSKLIENDRELIKTARQIL